VVNALSWHRHRKRRQASALALGPSALVGPAENPLWPGQTSARRLFGTDLADFGTRPQQFACGHEASRRRERLNLELNN